MAEIEKKKPTKLIVRWRNYSNTQSGTFGPFSSRGPAEACVAALAARSEVTSAIIMEEE